MESISWNSYFMSLVYLIALKSKDQSTKIGAVIVGPDKEIRSTGYNSFPMGINDNVYERQQRPEKYYWFAHAEKNSIDHAARIGVSVKGCTLYTQGTPCMDCARSIVQSGIKKVIVHLDWDEKMNMKWKENAKRTKQLFSEAGIEYIKISPEIINELYGYCSEERIYFNE